MVRGLRFPWMLPLLTLALAAGRTPAAERKAPPKRPNVLFVIADQWREQAFGFAGDPNVHTPNFDRFAAESIRLDQATSSVPVCCPTRATLLIGQRALTHGVFMNDVPLSPKADSIAKRFAAAGYDTGFIGKWHVDGHGRSSFIPQERRQGFDYWKVLECTHDYNHSLFYTDSPQRETWPGYDAEAQTADAEAYLSEHAKSAKPFFLMLSWGPPHDPYQTAPARYRELYSPTALKLRPNVPDALDAKARADLSGYYAHCTALDDCFGGLRDTCRKLGLDDNTLLVFTADHGDMLWSHGFQKKQQPYEESARVPLLFRFPRKLGTSGKVRSAPIGTEDIMPTVLRLCDLPVPATVEGRDYSGYLRGGKDPSDGASLIYCPAPFGQWSRSLGGREYRAIRTARYTYARDLHGPWLLYDNQEDPYQLHNLAGSPSVPRLQEQLDRRLRARLARNHDEFLPAAEYIRRWGYTVDATGTVPYTN